MVLKDGGRRLGRLACQLRLPVCRQRSPTPSKTLYREAVPQHQREQYVALKQAPDLEWMISNAQDAPHYCHFCHSQSSWLALSPLWCFLLTMNLVVGSLL
ncbi:hypothetical protein FF011L_38760 [Roseimaritima multifibrata]|uniref:Uncharacterized protein n=1 Tax=Roseimaritima multifibrata TaxID=1930274 RepID=A0A517MJM2_9BACT|nr:hypothetical protein FF011L_38760 [Roseimaritima multifibrata]